MVKKIKLLYLNHVESMLKNLLHFFSFFGSVQMYITKYYILMCYYLCILNTSQILFRNIFFNTTSSSLMYLFLFSSLMLISSSYLIFFFSSPLSVFYNKLFNFVHSPVTSESILITNSHGPII